MSGALRVLIPAWLGGWLTGIRLHVGLTRRSILGRLSEWVLNLFASVDGRYQHQQSAASNDQAEVTRGLVALIICTNGQTYKQVN